MATTEKIKNELTQKNTQVVTVETMVRKAMNTLSEALPAHMNAERLVRIALTTLRTNPKLYECDPNSFLGALFQSAQLGLEPNVEGQAYIIPFNNRRKIGNDWKTIKEAQFQIGYKGYVELFYRHKNAVSLSFNKVCEGDDFDFEYGTDAYLKHKPAWDSTDVVAYYAVAKLSNGGSIFKVMSQEECIQHGKQHSKCYDKKKEEFYANTPWATDPDAMCLKTVLIQLMKLLPKSFELQRAIASDETIKMVGPQTKNMFEVKDETNWEEGQVAEENGDKKPESPAPNAKTWDDIDNLQPEE